MMDIMALIQEPGFADLVKSGPTFEACTNDAELLAAHVRELYRKGWELFLREDGVLCWRVQRRLFRPLRKG
jgi:hypothetical protein